jgi:hypothetical protein
MFISDNLMWNIAFNRCDQLGFENVPKGIHSISGEKSYATYQLMNRASLIHLEQNLKTSLVTSKTPVLTTQGWPH